MLREKIREEKEAVGRRLILPRKPVKGFVKERPENGRKTKQVCAAI